jgi:predicted RNA-binding protein (virulence factor B family)
MLKFYHTNQVTVAEIGEFSIYIDGGEYGLIPLHETPEDIKIGDAVDAYIYLDATDDIIATMATAAAQMGECAYLKIISSDDRGTFLDWGLPKDLLLPLSEQTGRIREGDFCFVYIYQDEQHRPIASMKLHHFFDEKSDDLKLGQAVDLIIASASNLGFKAVIDNEYLGLIYHGELARPLEIGAKMKGWVQEIREDGKINVSTNRLDSEARDQLEETILNRLNENDGRLNLSDKSPPNLIYNTFGVSKKNFKRAIGGLYKQKLITIKPESIELISSSAPDNKE